MSDEPKTEEVDILSEKLDEVGRKFTTEIDASAEAIRAENTELRERLEKVEEKSRTLLRGSDNADPKPNPISIRKLACAIVDKDWTNAGYEREIIAESKRALSTTTDTAGGYIVGPEYMANEYIEMYRAQVVAIAAGARVMPGMTGSPILIPKQSTGATAYWTAENAAITASEQTFENLSLTPHKCAGLTKVSNELMRSSSPAAEGIIRDDLAQTIGRAIDLAVLTGTGASGQPVGISLTTGINTTTQNATTTLAHCTAMVAAVATDNALHGSLGWVMHPRTWNTISALLAAAGADYGGRWEGNLWTLPLLGYPVFLTTQLSLTLGGGSDESEMFFGNWNDVLIPEWGGIEFMASQHADTAFAADQTWIRATHIMDMGLREPESICYCLDVND